MAKYANSIPVPELPICPLPANASQAWHELWRSAVHTHSRASETIMHAYAAGVEPSELVYILLRAPKDQLWPMPRFVFGGAYISPARVFGPNGEVAS